MNDIKNILHKYLTGDEITMLAIEEKQDDRQWMTEKGYLSDIEFNKNGFPVKGGELTPKGEKFIEESDKKLLKLFEKTGGVQMKTMSELTKELQKHSKSYHDDKAYNELTEDEQFVYRKICFGR